MPTKPPYRAVRGLVDGILFLLCLDAAVAQQTFDSGRGSRAWLTAACYKSGVSPSLEWGLIASAGSAVYIQALHNSNNLTFQVPRSLEEDDSGDVFRSVGYMPVPCVAVDEELSLIDENGCLNVTVDNAHAGVWCWGTGTPESGKYNVFTPEAWSANSDWGPRYTNMTTAVFGDLENHSNFVLIDELPACSGNADWSVVAPGSKVVFTYIQSLAQLPTGQCSPKTVDYLPSDCCGGVTYQIMANGHEFSEEEGFGFQLYDLSDSSNPAQVGDVAYTSLNPTGGTLVFEKIDIPQVGALQTYLNSGDAQKSPSVQTHCWGVAPSSNVVVNGQECQVIHEVPLETGTTLLATEDKGGMWERGWVLETERPTSGVTISQVVDEEIYPTATNTYYLNEFVFNAVADDDCVDVVGQYDLDEATYDKTKLCPHIELAVFEESRFEWSKYIHFFEFDVDAKKSTEIFDIVKAASDDQWWSIMDHWVMVISLNRNLPKAGAVLIDGSEFFDIVCWGDYEGAFWISSDTVNAYCFSKMLAPTNLVGAMINTKCYEGERTHKWETTENITMATPGLLQCTDRDEITTSSTPLPGTAVPTGAATRLIIILSVVVHVMISMGTSAA